MMDSKERPPTDYRGMRKRNELWLLGAAIVVLVVVGGGLIGLLFGVGNMLTALPCLLAGAGAIAVLYLFIALLERWTER
jgi:amino acid transporter